MHPRHHTSRLARLAFVAGWVALGASVTHLRALVVGRVGWPAALGLSAGTCAAFAITPLLRPLLFEVSPLDVWAFAAGWMLLAVASIVASVIPLRRASRVDPAALLRSD